MQLSNVLATLLFSSVAYADPHGDPHGPHGEGKNVRHDRNSTGPDSVRRQCHQIERLQSLIAFAANTTLLDIITHSNLTKEAEIRSQAAEAQTKVTSLTSNTTLMGLCEIQYAHDKLEGQCIEIHQLKKIVEIAANTTELDHIMHGNANKTAAFKARAAQAQTMLTSLTANATLVDACNTLDAQRQAEHGQREGERTADKDGKKDAKDHEGKATDAKEKGAKATEAKATEAKATEAKATEAKEKEGKAKAGDAGKNAAPNVVANTGIFSTIVLLAALIVLL